MPKKAPSNISGAEAVAEYAEKKWPSPPNPLAIQNFPDAEHLGLRFDSNKPRYDLIPPAALKALAEHYAAGAKKYGDRNWEKGLSWNTCYRALLSHATEWFLGHTHDEDLAMLPYKGHHLIAVAWNAIALYEYERRKIGVDDRPEAQFELEL